MDALHARFRDITCKYFKKHGMTVVGFWNPTDPKEARTKLVYLLAHPSQEAAARSLGLPAPRIVLRHILPNVSASLMVVATFGVAGAILTEAGLSFLGLGLQPPTPSWGASLNAARNFIAEGPWMSFWPGLFICVAVFGFNLTGDVLRDLFDPQEA